MAVRIYVVGGAVRDALLNLPVRDRDYVVVGATPQDMLAQGFTPVGKDFPVFLHPKTHAEYALARTERKVAPGYKGFAFHANAAVTLEEDLLRRDLTINAIAQAEDGTLVDPYGGQEDIRRRVFRHVSPAFSEDPVRILRVARFAARFADFTIAPETLALMQQMVVDGETDALVPERVWQEMGRGLMEDTPSRMFAVLSDCGVLPRLMPEVASLLDGQALALLDRGAAAQLPLPARWMLVLHGLGSDSDAIRQLSDRLRAPSDCRDVALMGAREWRVISQAAQLTPDAMVALFDRCDAWRRAPRFLQTVDGAVVIAGDTAVKPVLERALAAAMSVEAGKIAKEVTPPEIPAAIRAARIAAISAM